MRNLAIVALAGALLFGAQSPPDDVQISGAVIRLTPAGVEILSDTSHTPVGVTDAYINSRCGCLTVVRDGAPNNVITTAVTTDEYLASQDIEVGLSGGGRISNIMFYRDGRKLFLHRPDQYALVAAPSSNLWFMVVSR